MDAIYAEMVGRHGLAPKPAMVGLSREALGTYRWASANPDKVACIFMDVPVCDMRSWPGGKRVAGSGSKADGAPEQWKLLLKTYGFKSDAEALAYRGSPVDLLEPLAKARVPILHVCGDRDSIVPVEENSTPAGSKTRRPLSHSSNAMPADRPPSTGLSRAPLQT
jgi:pimeloyl-ACP methyl ester carboxylesterase